MILSIRFTHLCFFLIPMMTLSFGSLPALQADTVLEVRLLSETEIASDRIRVGQVATIVGGTEDIRKTVAAIEIGPAPIPGRAAWIHQGQVKARLKKIAISPSTISVTAAGPVKVLRSYEDLTAKRICAAVKAYIYQSVPWDKDQIKIRNVTYNQSHRLPPGKLNLLVTAPKHTDWIGAIPFQVEAYIDGHLLKRMRVAANIEVWSDVLVAAKPMGRNQPIETTDIKTKRMNLSRTPKNAILRSDQLVGRRTTRAIAVNAILSTDQIENPPVIRKGDVVQVVAETPLLKITTQGLAKEKGGLGERIRVVNLRSKKVVYAQIVDRSTVRVPF